MTIEMELDVKEQGKTVKMEIVGKQGGWDEKVAIHIVDNGATPLGLKVLVNFPDLRAFVDTVETYFKSTRE